MWLTWIWSSVSPLTISSTGIAAPAHPLLGTARREILEARRSAFLTANMMLPSERRLKLQEKKDHFSAPQGWWSLCRFQHQRGCFLLISASYRLLLDWSGKGVLLLRKWDLTNRWIFSGKSWVHCNKYNKYSFVFYNEDNCSKYFNFFVITIAYYYVSRPFQNFRRCTFEVRMLMKRLWFLFLYRCEPHSSTGSSNTRCSINFHEHTNI